MADFSPRSVTNDVNRNLVYGGDVLARTIAGSLRDSSVPVLSNFSPVDGAFLSRTDPISFRVTDVLDGDEIAFAVQVSVYIVSTDTAELAYNGDGFENQYTTSTRVAYSTNGYTFTLRRRSGWPSGGVRVRVRVIDRGGNIGTL